MLELTPDEVAFAEATTDAAARAALCRRPGGGMALIAAGADPNAADIRPVIGNGATPLHFAADADDPELVRALIAAGAVVNARSLAGHTPLWWACNAGQASAARELLTAGADPNIRCKEGYTPLGRVFQSEQALVELMRSHGGVV